MNQKRVASHISDLADKVAFPEMEKHSSGRQGPYSWDEINTALYDGLRMSPANIKNVLFALPKRPSTVFTWEEINTALVSLNYPVPRIMKVLKALKTLMWV